METQEIADIQALINIFFPFAEELIVKFGEFFPYAGATTIEGEFVSVGFHDHKDHPPTEKVIAGLKDSLKDGSEKFLVTAVFYEVKTKDEESGKNQDAIAVFIEHKDGEKAYEFFYPYTFESPENFIVEDSYGSSLPKQIFTTT